MSTRGAVITVIEAGVDSRPAVSTAMSIDSVVANTGWLTGESSYD
jgi:hypothetical protein